MEHNFFYSEAESPVEIVMKSSGKGPATKSDEFLEKCQGGGSFSIQKFILQILGTLNRAF